MQIISSYGVELRKQNIPIRQTLEIYRSAVSYLIGIYVQVTNSSCKRLFGILYSGKKIQVRLSVPE